MIQRRFFGLVIGLLCALPASAQLTNRPFFDTISGIDGSIETVGSSALLPFVTGPTKTFNPSPALGLSQATSGRTFMGQIFTPAVTPGTVQPVTITKLDIVMYSETAVAYSGLRLRMQFFDAYGDGFIPGGDPANNPNLIFNTPLGGIQTQNLGALTTTADTLYFFSLNLPTPVTISPARLGSGSAVSFNFQGDTGSGFQTTDALGTAIRGGVGSPSYLGGNPAAAYYRNYNGRQDFNFVHQPAGTPGDNRSIGANSALAIRLYSLASTAPEPTSGLLALLALPVIARRARRR
jgi:hypothetical protein